MTIEQLKEILNRYPNDYKVKFYVDDKCFNIEANGDSHFNSTLFLFGNKEIPKEYTKEQMLEQLNKLIDEVNKSEKNSYIV